MTAVKMEASQSHDGLPSSPRHSQQSNHSRHSSLEHLRPRTSSTSSRRGQYPLQQSPLDTILASPKFTSAPSLPGTPTSSLYCSSPTPQSPQDRPYLTFKLLHPAANLVLRVPRANLTLGVLRSLVRDKFATSSCAMQLGGGGGGAGEDAHWGLAYTTPASEVGPCSTQLVISEEDFLGVLERTASLEKVALRIVE